MIRDLLTAFVVIGAVGQLASPSVVPPQQPPANITAGNVSPDVTPLDPAAVVFATEAGMVLHAVKPGAVTDYEAAIAALQGAFATSDDPDTRRVASGWRVYKATEGDAKASAIYVHFLQPVAAGTDYRPSLWLDRLLAGAPPELLAKYRDSFATPPTKLSLTELANMIEMPPERPSNASPVNATPPKPPGDGADFDRLRR